MAPVPTTMPFDQSFGRPIDVMVLWLPGGTWMHPPPPAASFGSLSNRATSVRGGDAPGREDPERETSLSTFRRGAKTLSERSASLVSKVAHELSQQPPKFGLAVEDGDDVRPDLHARGKVVERAEARDRSEAEGDALPAEAGVGEERDLVGARYAPGVGPRRAAPDEDGGRGGRDQRDQDVWRRPPPYRTPRTPSPFSAPSLFEAGQSYASLERAQLRSRGRPRSRQAQSPDEMESAEGYLAIDRRHALARASRCPTGSAERASSRTSRGSLRSPRRSRASSGRSAARRSSPTI